MLESPLDCKEIQPVHPKGDQSWLFFGRTDTEAELQYFGHLMWRVDSFEKTLMLGKIERRRRGGRQRMRWLDGWMASPTQRTWVWVNSGSWWLTGRPGMLQSRGSQRVRHDWVTELNWTLNAGLCTLAVVTSSSWLPFKNPLGSSDEIPVCQGGGVTNLLNLYGWGVQDGPEHRLSE